MKSIPLLLMVALVCLSVGRSEAEAIKDGHIEVELVSEEAGIQPGKPFWVALHMTMDQGWHTYWKNPGDSGLATTIKWQLPEGFEPQEIQWPFPERFDEAGLTTYGYEGEVFLLTQIHPPMAMTQTTVPLKAKVKWLACEKICVPGRADVTLNLPISETPPNPSEWQKAFFQTRQKLPQKVDWFVQAHEDKKFFYLHIRPPSEEIPLGDHLEFFPERKDVLEHAAKQTLKESSTGWELILPKSSIVNGAIGSLQGTLVITRRDGSKKAIEVVIDQ